MAERPKILLPEDLGRPTPKHHADLPSKGDEFPMPGVLLQTALDQRLRLLFVAARLVDSLSGSQLEAVRRSQGAPTFVLSGTYADPRRRHPPMMLSPWYLLLVEGRTQEVLDLSEHLPRVASLDLLSSVGSQ